MKSKIRSKLIIILITGIFAFSFFTPVFAYNFEENSGLNTTAAEAGYTEDIQNRSIEETVSRIITAVLSIIGILFLILMVYGGYIWMTANGNQENVKRASQIIVEGVIGLIVVLGAYAISWFIINYFWK